MMALVMDITNMDWALELLSPVGFEVAIFSFAFCVYLAYSGGLMPLASRGRPHVGKGGKQRAAPAGRGGAASASSTAALGLLKSLDQGKLSEASSVLEQLPPAELDAVLAVAAPRLLVAVAKASPSDAEACLRIVAANIKPRMLEAAMSQALKRGHSEACLELGRLSEQFQIPVPPRGVELLKQARHLDKSSASAVLEKIRNFGRSGDLPSAVEAFEQAQDGGNKVSALLHNGIIEACMECKDYAAAAAYLVKAQALGLADAATFNTSIRRLLAAGEEATAGRLLKTACKLGAEACRPSYHAVLNARAEAGDRQGAMRLVEEMRATSVSLNAVSCSILLKMVVGPSHSPDLLRVMKLIESQGFPMDEVLLSSIVEASLKCGRLEVLTKALERNRAQPGGGLALMAPMYGSMIKAFGQAGEVVRIWSLWNEMSIRGVQPTAITLGCMVEALVANRRPEEAYKLVYEAWGDEDRAHLVTTVTCTTLLKGLAKSPEQVLGVYKEMRSRGVDCNTIAYNTILNVFAQSRSMHHVPRILEEMKAATPPVEPDVVTYSTLIKGFCASGGLDKAFVLLSEMQREGKHQADEMMYNSLLDGCAREQRLQDALRLVDEMRQAGVRPSNYTLSMLVKLLGRCRRMDQAFAMVESISAEFGFRPNIQVHTCLIQACFYNRQAGRAAATFSKLLEGGLAADAKLFSVVVRGHLQAGQPDKAAAWARRSYETKEAPGIEAQCLDELLSKLGSGSPEAKSLLESANACRRQRPWARR